MRSARGRNSSNTRAPPKTITSGAAPARFSASSAVRATRQPSQRKSRSRVITMLVRPGSGRPMESQVRRPMMSGFPMVISRTCFMSSGSRQGRRLSFPIVRFRSYATTNEMVTGRSSTARRSHRHLRFDRRMELVLLEARDGIEHRPGFFAGASGGHDLAVARDHVVEASEARIERQTRGRVWLARKLLSHGVLVIAIDVRVGEHVDELIGYEAAELGDEMQQHRVLRHVERHAEEEIAGALIHHDAEPSVRDEELE